MLYVFFSLQHLAEILTALAMSCRSPNLAMDSGGTLLFLAKQLFTLLFQKVLKVIGAFHRLLILLTKL